MSIRELFRREPSATSIPHVELAQLPTPVEMLAGTAERLGLDELWVKRDDLTGTLYGGNKVRKLEFLLADAIERGHDEVWTVGAIGSHHVLATCIWARHLGLGCGAIHFPQPVTKHVQDNVRALSTTAPRVHLLTEEMEVPSAVFGRRLREWLAKNPDAYYIPAGGSSGIGALGYVNAALEFVAQVEASDVPSPDRIYVAAGTCGTLAGLLLGFQIAGFEVDVVGVRVVESAIANPGVVRKLYDDARRRLVGAGADDPGELAEESIRFDDRYFGPAYGVPTAEAFSARDLVEAEDGLTLEPTYTAKAFAAIVDQASAIVERGERVLYWHTLSGADLSERIANADLEVLPDIYRRWLEIDTTDQL